MSASLLVASATVATRRPSASALASGLTRTTDDDLHAGVTQVQCVCVALLGADRYGATLDQGEVCVVVVEKWLLPFLPQ